MLRASTPPDSRTPTDLIRGSGRVLAIALVSVVAVAVAGVPLGAVASVAFALVVAALPRAGTQARRWRIERPSATIAHSDRALLVVRVEGPLTFLSRGELHDVIQGPPWPSFVLLDLSGVDFVDAGGVGELEELAEFLWIRGARVALARAPSRTSRSIHRRADLRRFAGGRVFPSIDAALDALESPVGSSRRHPSA